MKILIVGFPRSLTFLLIGLSVVFLAACAGDDGKDGAAGQDGQNGQDGTDVTEQQPITSGNFTIDILPLFTKNDVYFDGALACSECHFAASADSLHELNMGSYNGILTGADAFSNQPPNTEDLLGRTGSCVGSTDVTACPPAWGESGLRRRLRNTRMPPGWPFDLGEGNRGTVEIRTVEAWVTDGAKDGTLATCTGTQVCYNSALSALRFAVGSTSNIDVGGAGTDPGYLISESLTVGDLFTTGGAYFVGSQACDDCHGALGFSWHDLNMGSYTGILQGADYVSDTDREDILGRVVGTAAGQCAVATNLTGDCAPVWAESGLRRRLRNTRMPPGWPFDLGESNRDMWAIESVKAWVEAGAPNGNF